MRKCLVLALFGVFVTTLVFAATEDANWTSESKAAEYWLNNNDVQHTHEYSQTSKYKAPLGVGVDVILYEMETLGVPLGIGVDTAYDLNNGVFEAYGKVKVNLSPIIKGFIGIK